MNIILKIISILQAETKHFTPTLIDMITAEYGKDPFLILISCLISLRAKDLVTIHICRELFQVARTPQEICDISTSRLEKILFKVGFYKNKARILKEVSQNLIDKFNGKVPNTLEELTSIKGVGLKTANLVLGLAFDIPAICVDIHVHRISNRLGLINTKTPHETEVELKKIIPKKYWIEWNRLLVQWGQNICVPISPFCSKCAIRQYCERKNVTKSR